MLTKKALVLRKLAAALIAALLFVVPAAAEEREKVILDSDTVEMYDDGMALLMLALSPKIDLLGVTVVTGNTWSADGAAFALKQLEGIGKAGSIPVAVGCDKPLRRGRLDNIREERDLFGVGQSDWLGSAGYPHPKSWQETYRFRYNEAARYAPVSEDAVDFLIRQIRANPHEITITAIGPCTNIATALHRAPEIASLVKRVVLMGGSFFRPGNVTPAAEFNFWFDPEAARMVLRAPFPDILIVPLDVCERVFLTAAKFNETEKNINNPLYIQMLHRLPQFGLFLRDPDYKSYVWDTIAAACLIDPSMINEEVTLPVDVNADYSLSYGQSLAFKGKGPEGARSARIVLGVDEDKLWRLIFACCRQL